MLHAKGYIIHKLTDKFITDYSDVSGTNLMDIERKQRSQEMLQALEISEELVPKLHASSDIADGVTKEAARAMGLLEGTPVVIGGGDGSCACVGLYPDYSVMEKMNPAAERIAPNAASRASMTRSMRCLTRFTRR